MRRNKILKLVAVILLAMAAIRITPLRANAQSAVQPQIFLTWQTNNSYVPSSYIGKILPNSDSFITASVSLIANGHPVDVSGQTIYWYVNDALVGGGIGQQNITFRARGDAPDIMTLRVELPNYPTGLLIYQNAIPLIQPAVVIEAPYPNGDFSGTQADVEALPYFFDTSSSAELGFTWTVNGQAVTGALNPQSLQVSLPQSTPSGYSVAIALAVQHGKDEVMVANSTANLTYQPQP